MVFLLVGQSWLQPAEGRYDLGMDFRSSFSISIATSLMDCLLVEI